MPLAHVCAKTTNSPRLSLQRALYLVLQILIGALSPGGILLNSGECVIFTLRLERIPSRQVQRLELPVVRGIGEALVGEVRLDIDLLLSVEDLVCLGRQLNQQLRLTDEAVRTCQDAKTNNKKQNNQDKQHKTQHHNNKKSLLE